MKLESHVVFDVVLIAIHWQEPELKQKAICTTHSVLGLKYIYICFCLYAAICRQVEGYPSPRDVMQWSHAVRPHNERYES